jgi:hypothetical protein
VKPESSKYWAFFVLLMTLLLLADPVLATQTHGEPEGLYVHQIAHLFFIISMGSLEFWLRQRNLVQEPGWKYIQLAAIFFIVWNLDAVLVHLMDEHLDILGIAKIDLWHIQIESSQGHYSLPILYYVLKLDHLFCVPAMFFLYLGLRRLVIEAENRLQTERRDQIEGGLQGENGFPGEPQR